ncbi:MAG: DUF192 domain-containing protein [Kiritimatiellae bacterium]|nr:DUF192 domain-containing protein [Kiritimatiellia bacterium]
MKEERLELPVFGAVRCLWAETPLERARGLIGRPPPPPGTVMGFRRCRALHTCFMRRPIDVLFVDRAGRAVKTLRGVRPWRLFVWGGFRAAAAFERASVNVRID